MKGCLLAAALALLSSACPHDTKDHPATALPEQRVPPASAETAPTTPGSSPPETPRSAAPATSATSVGACPSPLGASSISFVDVSDSKAQGEYSDAYNYMVGVIDGPCPPTHVDITVSGHGILGGVRARVERLPNGDLELLADPTPPDPERMAWQPEVKPGQRLATITMKNGVATHVVLPKLAAPNRGLLVHHPGQPLAVEP